MTLLKKVRNFADFFLLPVVNNFLVWYYFITDRGGKYE